MGAWILGGASVVAIGCNVSRGNDGSDPPVDDVPPVTQLLAAQPTFGPGVTLASPPPPISGGTLAVAPDGITAVAADPDRDRVYVVDLPSRAVVHTVQLSPGDEPGRVAIDSNSRAYVALRKGGALLTVDAKTGITERRPVCSAPRGVAVDEATSSVVVVCADGMLARLPTGTGAVTLQAIVEQDLRDVIVQKDGDLMVSTFRRAGLLHLGPAGNVIDRSAAPDGHSPNVMWRMVSLDLGDGVERVLSSAQRPRPDKISVASGGYGGGQTTGCPIGIVAGQLVVGKGGAQDAKAIQMLPQVTLPVDIATDGLVAVIVGAGNAHTPSAPQIFIQPLAAIPDDVTVLVAPDCAVPQTATTPGQPTAVAFDGAGELIVQSREPAELYIMSPDRARVWKTIKLAKDSREDTGHAIFHSNSGAGVACASCHAEGGDDAHTWEFDDLGPRRTPSLRGTAAHTEPYHWDGSQKDMNDIVTHIFEGRMSGPQLPDSDVAALKSFVYTLPAPPPLRGMDDAAVRGRALFESQGCSGCHSGPMLTNNQTVDVGTGGAFQVPSLKGVGWRAPFLHDGCAATLAERFGPCGGDKHGQTSDLGPVGTSDLEAFLQTL